MFKIYFKVALRNLLRNRLHAAVDILGLSVGIAVSIVVFLYIQSEVTYDSYHSDGDRIYRLTSNFVMNGERERTAVSSSQIGPLLKEEVPEIEAATRMVYISRSNVSSDYATFDEDHLLAADEGVFEVFDYKLLRGDPATCLKNPQTIVITESFAKRYFGQRDPMGQILVSGTKRQYTVTGIMEDIPENTHHYFDALISLCSLPKDNLDGDESTDLILWSASVYTFLLLKEDYQPKDFYTDLHYADTINSN